MKQMLLAAVFAGVAMVVSAETEYEWIGNASSSWRDLSSYKDATTLPGPGDKVEIPASGQATVTDADAALVAGLHVVKVNARCELTVNVTTDTVFSCAICREGESVAGNLIKTGAGRLTLTASGRFFNSSGYYNDYCTAIHVKAGTLVLPPDVPADRGSNYTLAYGLLTVDAGATLILPWSNGMVATRVMAPGLEGAGTISNNMAVAHYIQTYYADARTNDFSGQLALYGTCRIRNNQNLSGTNNVFRSGNYGPIAQGGLD